mmetsp:Transcript_4151/g.9862  ORF Transcript_4151/g.9862 Transcript_4151/m.9862 type:complete len:261 (-) Transcript_4151:419-1201(-)
MIRLELQAGLGGAGVGVFQEGRLIEDDPRPRGVEEEGLPVRATGDVDLVIGEHAGVGGDDEVDVLETAPKVGAVAVRHIHDDLGVDGVLLELVLPLVREVLGHHQHRGVLPDPLLLVLIPGEQLLELLVAELAHATLDDRGGDGGEGLAQAHLVPDDAATGEVIGPVLARALLHEHEGHRVLLVRPQLALDVRRELHLLPDDGLERVEPVVVGLQLLPELEDLDETGLPLIIGLGLLLPSGDGGAGGLELGNHGDGFLPP